MKTILSLLLITLLHFYTFIPRVAAAANPDASLRTNPTRRYVFLTFTNLQTVSKINYTLTYETNSVTKGFEGGFKLFGRHRRSVRRQILGTCSSGKCVFHKNPKGFQLDVTFYLKSGGTTTVSRTLP